MDEKKPRWAGLIERIDAWDIFLVGLGALLGVLSAVMTGR